MNNVGQPAIAATCPESMAVQVNGTQVPIESADLVYFRIDRIVEVEAAIVGDSRRIYKAIAGPASSDPRRALPPAIPTGWRHVGLVMVHPAASVIYNGMITTLHSWTWPRDLQQEAVDPVDISSQRVDGDAIRAWEKRRAAQIEQLRPLKAPMPPSVWLRGHTDVSDRAAAGAGWQQGWLAGQAAARGHTSDGEPLTADEHRFMELTADLATLLARIVGHDRTRPADLNEATVHVHALQAMVLAQAAARAYPGRYRLLGGTVATPSRSEEPE